MTTRRGTPLSGRQRFRATPSSGIRTVTASVAVLGLLASACGGSSSGAEPTTQSSEAPRSDAQPVTATQTTGPERPIGPPLGPRSSANDILVAVEEVHGPTSDASAQMNRFASFPALATPAEAELSEMRVDARFTVDAESITVTSQVTLDVAATAGELLRFYVDELDVQAWLPISDQGTSGPNSTRLLAFEKPDSAYPLADLTVAIIPTEPGRSRVRLNHVELLGADATDGTEVLDRLAGWAEGLPLPEGGEITGAGIQTSAEVRDSLFYSLTVTYDDLEPAEAADELRGALPMGDFNEAPEPRSGDSLDNWVFLTSPLFTEAQVSPHITQQGTTQLAVNARVPFTPR